MAVCPKCKTENDEYRLRCGKCGTTMSKRGEYREQQGPNVVVLGSVEDLRRAREQGELQPDDPTALGWLESEVEDSMPLPVSKSPTRRVSVREIDKISGLRDLRDLQAALLKEETSPAPAPSPPVTESRRVAKPPSGDAPKTDSKRLARNEAPAPPTAPAPAPPEAPAQTDVGDDGLEEIPTAPATAYLANELFPEAVPLAPGRRYLMGRDPRASIFLPSSHVSRRHAGIAADIKGDYWIEDLRSSNGTYVNGRAVLKRRLKHGDLLDVGVFTFRFVVVKPGEPAPALRSDPDEDTRAIRAVPGSLAGEIEQNKVVPVLALICSARRSGVLTLRAGPQVGRVFVVGGEIHHAQFGKTTGEQALAALLPAEGGFLHFSDEKINVKRTITRSTDEIFGSPT